MQCVCARARQEGKRGRAPTSWNAGKSSAERQCLRFGGGTSSATAHLRGQEEEIAAERCASRNTSIQEERIKSRAMTTKKSSQKSVAQIKSGVL